MHDPPIIARMACAILSVVHSPMKFAHFSHIWAKPGMTPHQRYEQLWRELQLCDELGFDHSFCVEHHFRPDESWMSSPSLYASRRRRADQAPAHRADGLYRAALSSAAARRGDRHRRSDARRPHGAWARARHQSGLFPSLRLWITGRANRRRSNSSIICARRSATCSRSRFTVTIFTPTTRRSRCRRAAPASAAVDDEPRSADARILRAERHQSRLLSGLSARRCGAALPQIPRRLDRRPARRENRTSPIAPSSMSTRPTRRRSRTRCFAPAAPTRVS